MLPDCLLQKLLLSPPPSTITFSPQTGCSHSLCLNTLLTPNSWRPDGCWLLWARSGHEWVGEC